MLQNLPNRLKIIAGGILLLMGISGGIFYFLSQRVSTDNAYLKGDITLLSPKISGYVTKIHWDDNQRVKKGEALVTIDQRDFMEKVTQAESLVASMKAQIENLKNQEKAQEAKINQVQAGIEGAEATFVKTGKDLKRAERLTPEGAITRQTLDGATADFKNAKAGLTKGFAELEAAKNQLHSIQAKLSQAESLLKHSQASLVLARIDLENTVVRAPQEGIVGNRLVQQGQLVKPGSVLAYLIPTETVWIEANFKETQIENLRPGQPATITLDAYPHKKLTGWVHSLAPASGSEFSILPPENATGNFTKITRRIPVKILFDKDVDKTLLKPGLSAVVTVKLVPSEAS